MPFDRRSMLRTAAAAAGVAALGCEDKKTAPKAEAEPTPIRKRTGGLPAPVLEVLAAVSERILPSEGPGPGAKEANVATYLDRTLADPRMRNLVPMLKRASGVLNKQAHKAHGQARFAALSPEQQDAILEGLASGEVKARGVPGPAFMRVMVALTLEGYLGDPSHGGNKGRVAWEWVGFHPEGRAAVFARGG